jgi:hypothetical protein
MKFCNHGSTLSVNSSGHGGLDMKIDDETFVITTFEYCVMCGAYRTERDKDWVAPKIQAVMALAKSRSDLFEVTLEGIQDLCKSALDGANGRGAKAEEKKG